MHARFTPELLRVLSLRADELIRESAEDGRAQILELTLQLQGRAGQRQVEGARIGLAHNGGGTIKGPGRQKSPISSAV